MTYDSAARVWRKSAIDALNTKDYKKASQLYFRAANEYKKEWENASNDAIKKTSYEQMMICIKKGQECKNPRVEIIRPQSKQTGVVTRTGSLESIVDEEIGIRKKKPRYKAPKMINERYPFSRAGIIKYSKS